MDTIFALSSGRPPAAVAVIRISGPRAHGVAASIAGELPPLRTAALRELRDPGSSEVLDQALLFTFAAPASATGEDVVELHCHGGRAVVDSVLRTLALQDGLRAALPGEFTRRAFENGRIDLTEAEGLADLIEAETEFQRKAALALAEGGLRKQIAEWQQRVLALSAIAERAIDYDEDDAAVDPALKGGCRSLADDLGQWLSRPRVEPLKDGVRIIVAGPPNVGKSSLVNAIAGNERAIVTALPGTTRDHIDVPLSLAGLPVLLTDTAGLRDSDDEVEGIGIARARSLIEAADIVLWLGQPDHAPDHPRLILVHSKADLPERELVPGDAFAVSSVTGDGLTQLLTRVADGVHSIVPAEGVVALNRRQATQIGEAEAALRLAAVEDDAVLIAELLRQARAAFDRLTGAAGMEDVLDALFSRFCLGK